MKSARSAPDLRVIAIVPDAATITLLQRTLAGSRDRLSVATDLGDGLVQVQAQAPDLAIVDVALGDGAGLAVLHHVSVLSPGVVVYALTAPERLDLGVQALALGSAGVLVRPLSGDEVASAIGATRARVADRLERSDLLPGVGLRPRAASLSTGVAEIAAARTRPEAAERIAQVIAAAAGATDAVVYLTVAEGSRQLSRAFVLGSPAAAPTFCEEMEALTYAVSRGLQVVRLALLREFSGLVLIGGGDVRAEEDVAREPLVQLLASQAATVLCLIGAREQSPRGAIKDASSSAYSFAYFVDVAGREIAMARRHHRRFSVATVGLPVTDTAPSETDAEPIIRSTERLLGAMRDTDVLARGDASEYFLLLPETGGTGANACRRRVLAGLRAAPASRVRGGVGFATFPHDGADLSQLLRVAKFRAEASSGSVVERLNLWELSLAAIVDALLGAAFDASARRAAPLETPHHLALPLLDLVGLSAAAVSEAARGGQTRVLCTRRAGLSVASGLGLDSAGHGEAVHLERVDVSREPGCDGLDVLVVIAEHGTYALAGRVEGDLMRAVHAADPLLSDLLLARLSAIVGRASE